MTSLKLLLITFSLSLLYNEANTQVKDEWVSPCPRLFMYETKNEEPDKWYGIVTLLSETDLQGIWLRIILDRTSLQLGNWFGQVLTTDNKDYLIKNLNVTLKANESLMVRFFIKYNTTYPPPKFVKFRLNGRRMCEEIQTEAPPNTIELRASTELNTFLASEGFIDDNNNGDGQYQQILPINVNRNHDAICGTVVKKNRLKRQSTDDDFYGSFESSNKEEQEQRLRSYIRNVAQPRPPLFAFGKITEEGEFPWHAALYHVKGIDLTYVCGASLISEYYVITAAHCVMQEKSQNSLNPEDLIIHLGKYNLKLFASSSVQERMASEILPHPQFNAQTYDNNIALVKFNTPINFTDYIRPVCLWQDSSDLNSVLNKNGTVVGWDFGQIVRPNETLLEAEIPIVAQETCLSSSLEFYSRFTTNNTYCAGFTNGSSVCNGDSGGGMVFPKAGSDPNNPVWQLRGLVSITVALKNRFQCDNYAVFTDIAKYLDWIKKTVLI